jgi:hypothetical protein
MRRARYEILADDQTYYGEIPECEGVQNAKAGTTAMAAAGAGRA